MNEISYIANKLDKKWIKTFKQLGNQVKALSKTKYVELLQDIDNYYITVKTDGLRCFLMISSKYIKYITSEDVIYLQIQNIFANQYIFDCEIINSKIFIFDTIVYNDINVSTQSFQHRYKLLTEFQDKLRSGGLTEFIEVKQFTKLTIANYQNSILNLYKMQTQKSFDKLIFDGLIFIEINKNYNRTINLKWKPPEYLTIDFLALKTESNQYILAVGIKYSLLKLFNIVVDPTFKSLLNTVDINQNENYVPIPFYNSLIPNIYNYTHSDDTDLNGHIIELSLNKDMTWVFHRIRYDRDVELKSGSYYGNNYKVAETTLASIINPLLIKDLITPYNLLVKDIYFLKQDESYKSIKYFNNYIKNLLISKYKSEYVIDLATGRGGDLNKYIQSNTKDILMLEVDTNAIEEIINRKYSILDNNKSLNLVVLQMDLNREYKKNIQIIDSNFSNNQYINKNNILGTSSDVIFCHFAMHYFLTTEKSANNIISFISHYLKKNGKFIMTIFDGQRVFDLLKKNKGLWKVDKKYMIKYLGRQPNIFSGFGHMIDILLPFSNIPYQESLIDLYALDKLFKKNNIFRTEEKNFNDLGLKNQIDINDQIFTGLYKYVIYTKH